MKNRTAIRLSVMAWIIYGAMTNVKDLNTYGLYQAGAESLVEHRTFTLGHSQNAELRDSGDGDLFIYHGQKFAAKQPGIFLLNALPYAILHFGFGMSYANDYDRVASIITWTTTALLVATSVGVFYSLILSLGASPTGACLTAVAYAWGSTLFPYTGIPHHDGVATALLVFALASVLGRTRERVLSFSTGYCLGLVLCFSMLPALILAAVLSFAFFQVPNPKKLRILVGFGLGVLPLAAYNFHYFGSPFTQANLAGNYQDTFFRPSTELFLKHFHTYFSWQSNLSVTKYMPIFYLGLAGVFFFPAHRRREKLMIASAIIFHVFYLLSIQTDGHCQYGPRYFIPLIPFALLGLPQWWTTHPARLALRPIFVLVLGYSLAVNLVGAFGNTMYCDFLQFGFIRYWQDFEKLKADQFLLWPSGLATLVVYLVLDGWMALTPSRQV